MNDYYYNSNVIAGEFKFLTSCSIEEMCHQGSGGCSERFAGESFSAGWLDQIIQMDVDNIILYLIYILVRIYMLYVI